MHLVVTIAVLVAVVIAVAADFPQRNLLVMIALTVTAGTLFLQGSTLPWLVRRLRLPGPDPREDALVRAALFQQAGAAGRTWLEAHAHREDEGAPVEAVRRRAERRDLAAWEQLASPDAATETPSDAYARLRLGMLRAEREQVLEVCSSRTVPHEVVEEVLAALDVEESMLDAHTDRPRGRQDDRETRMTNPTLCDHLAEAATTTPPTDPVCGDCVAEGTTWAHLRMCLRCGNVACCDSSPRRHATGHFESTGHPVMRSAEPGERWRWCFVDGRLG